MSYLVLARKYRPRNFTEMVGQEHVVQALTNALTQQRLHHAYLFTGTRGVGKTTVSRILAKSLNCQGPDGQGGITATPCGVCQACRDIDSGRFVDYTELDAASNRGVDEVQSLLEQAVYKPVQGRFKVFMIDEVHMLTNTAFNAMLKTLEEPPEYLKFVLATTDPQKVPVTVLSRCLQFNLRPMAPETVLDHLVQVLAQENVPAEPQALRLLARAARGSMRDALSLTDQAIAFGSGRLEEPTVRLMLGSVDRSYVFRLVGALAEGDGKTVVETVDVLRVHGLSAASTLEDMAAVLQRMAVLQAVPQAGHPAADASDPDAADLASLAALLPPDETQLLYSICLHGRAELGLAPDEYAALTMVLLRLLAFKPAALAGAAAGRTAEKKTLKTAENPFALPAGPGSADTAGGAGSASPAPDAVSVPAAPADARASPAHSGAPQAPVHHARHAAASAPQAVSVQPDAPGLQTAPVARPVTASAPVSRFAPQAKTVAADGFSIPPWEDEVVPQPVSHRPVVQVPAAPAPQTGYASAVPERVRQPAGDAGEGAGAPGRESGSSAGAQPAQSARPALPAQALREKPTSRPPALDDRAEVAIAERATYTTALLPESSPAAAAPDWLVPAADAKAAAAAAPAPAPAPAHGVRFAQEGDNSQAGAADAAHGARPPCAQSADGDVWHSVVQQLIAAEAITALVRELALQSQLVARDGGHWHLRVERASTNQPTARERLRAALQAAGHAVQISVDVGAVSDSPARRNALAEQERQRVARDIVMNDPLVQALVKNHDAKIVPGSIRPL